MSTDGEGRPRGPWRLILSRDFGTFFFARLTTSIGVWVHGIVAAIAAFETTGSGFFVGAVSAAQFVPQIIFGPLAGSWADRGSVQFQMMLGRAILALGSISLGVWYLFFSHGSRNDDAIAILLASAVAGIGLVIGGAAMQATPPLLVSRAELPTAMALSTAPMTIGRIAGPAAGALGIVLVGFGGTFVLAGVLSVVFLVLLALVRFPSTGARRAHMKNPMREALAYIREDRPVLLALVAVTAIGMGTEPLMTLAPALASELGGGTALVGTLLTGMGIGAAAGVLIGSAFAARFKQEWAFLIGVLLLAASLVACAVPLPELLVTALFVVAGFGFIITQTALGTIMQLRLPPHFRGRVMALWLIGFVGSRPIGGMLVGAVSDVWNVYFAFALAGLFLFGAAYVCRPSRLGAP